MHVAVLICEAGGNGVKVVTLRLFVDSLESRHLLGQKLVSFGHRLLMTQLLSVVVFGAVFLVRCLVPLNNDWFLGRVLLGSRVLSHAQIVNKGVSLGRDVLLRLAHLGQNDVLRATNERILLAFGHSSSDVHRLAAFGQISSRAERHRANHLPIRFSLGGHRLLVVGLIRGRSTRIQGSLLGFSAGVVDVLLLANSTVHLEILQFVLLLGRNVLRSCHGLAVLNSRGDSALLVRFLNDRLEL